MSKNSELGSERADAHEELEAMTERSRSLRERLKKRYYDPNLVAGPRLRNFYPDSIARDLDQMQQGWDLYAGALKTAIQGDDSWKNLQIVTVPSPIGWDDPDFGQYYFHHDTSDDVNNLGSSYSKSGKSFAECYGDFLNDVQRPVVDDTAQAKARAALVDIETDSKRHDELVDNIQLEWEAFDDRQRSSLPPSKWVVMKDWYAGTYGAGHTSQDAIIQNSAEVVLSVRANYLYWIQKAFSGQESLIKKIASYQDYQKLMVSAPRLDGNSAAGKAEVYGYQISPDYPGWLADARAGKHQRVSFSIRSDTYSYSSSQTQIGAGIAIGFGFFGVLAGAQRNTVQIDTSSSGFSLDFEADLRVFTTTPGAWYSSDLFSMFQAGPFYPGSPMDNLNKQGALWGPRGFLGFRPARAIVAYKPKITVHVSQSEYHYFKQVTSGAVAFYIGPFAVGAGQYYDVHESVSWNDSSCTLQLYNAPDAAMLLAFDSQGLP